MIEISELRLSYGKLEVLKGINLNIYDGDIYGLVGQSGAGKSTLLSCINGLQKYETGSLKVDGVEVKDLKKNLELRQFRRNIGMIFQQFAIIDRETVYKNIAIPLECWKYKKSEIDKKVKELVRLVGLEEKIKEKAKNLSGGQKQRVAIARALALDSKILLCDEATSALDPKITKDILALLRKVNETLGVTIVVVTHEMSVVKQICNRVAVLDGGKVAVEGTVEDILLHSPQVFAVFTGDNETELLPEKGKNIRIIYTEDSQPERIFSELGKELEIDYTLTYGTMDEYRGRLMGSIYINVERQEVDRIMKYLNKKSIKAEVM
ncbi:ATP-binding cassette domain-containing protein [Mordavella massiliensis]|uniref:methionine ABC transporter ATP-binding protein n=1 Tax=Mordavella massiliensis TaxID=1871024 RepID=UPI00210928A4|nr:methionine ABC transporter ATP-binding protein [Mordavella massiliensis]